MQILESLTLKIQVSKASQTAYCYICITAKTWWWVENVRITMLTAQPSQCLYCHYKVAIFVIYELNSVKVASGCQPVIYGSVSRLWNSAIDNSKDEYFQYMTVSKQKPSHCLWLWHFSTIDLPKPKFVIYMNKLTKNPCVSLYLTYNVHPDVYI